VGSEGVEYGPSSVKLSNLAAGQYRVYAQVLIFSFFALFYLAAGQYCVCAQVLSFSFFPLFNLAAGQYCVYAQVRVRVR
jgi:hypothetical protein